MDIFYPIVKNNVYNSNNTKILEIPSVVIGAVAHTGKEFDAYFVKSKQTKSSKQTNKNVKEKCFTLIKSILISISGI